MSRVIAHEYCLAQARYVVGERMPVHPRVAERLNARLAVARAQEARTLKRKAQT